MLVNSLGSIVDIFSQLLQALCDYSRYTHSMKFSFLSFAIFSTLVFTKALAETFLHEDQLWIGNRCLEPRPLSTDECVCIQKAAGSV